jgi:LmbE family N-acetylglucosaminyl deacetylase
MHRTIIIAPHPDDELLGVGGTICKRREEGNEIGWVIMTKLYEDYGWTREKIVQRNFEIETVREMIGINKSHLYQLEFPTTKLDMVHKGDMVKELSKVISDFKPQEIFLPHSGDAHSDHTRTFETVSSSCKWFRASSVRKILSYETLSETESNLDEAKPFNPNYFVNITEYISKKKELLSIYKSEMHDYPFPRSMEAVEALSKYRGAQSGYQNAEAFRLLKCMEC